VPTPFSGHGEIAFFQPRFSIVPIPFSGPGVSAFQPRFSYVPIPFSGPGVSAFFNRGLFTCRFLLVDPGYQRFQPRFI
jgi:hypothetical protein